MTARRFFSITGAATVGVIAGIASYTHMRDVGLATHQGAVISSLVPLSVDGLVLVATLAIGDGRKHTFTAWLAFLIGVGVSLAANVAAADPNALARCWSAWPSAGFLLAVEVLIRGGRKLPADLPQSAAAKPSERDGLNPSQSDGFPSSSRPSPRRPSSTTSAARVAAASRRMPGASPAQIAAKVGVSESTARRHLASPTTDAPATTNGFDVLEGVKL